MIVLNEYEWVERVLNAREIGKKPTETLNRVARYYYSNGYNKTQIRNRLEVFLIQCIPSTSVVHWNDALDRIVKNVAKYPLIQIESIDIFKNEMDIINSLKGKQIRRLAFTLLCVSKYWDLVSEHNNRWVNTPDKDLMKMSNINTSIKRQSSMFSDLRDAGMIKFSKKVDNLNVQMCMPSELGDIAIKVCDFRNLGYQYLKYLGEPFFECTNCGITSKQNISKGRRNKYCSNCAVQLHTKQRIESVMRKRDLDKNNNVDNK